MKKFKLLGLLLLCLIFSSFVFGVGQSSEWNFNQLIIIDNNNKFLNVDENNSFVFSVTNSSGSSLTNTDVDCDCFIYSDNNVLLQNESLNNSGNGVDKVLVFDNNINNVGSYTYKVLCNGTGEFGYLSNSFSLTKSGLSYDNMFKIVLIYIIGLITILIILLYVVFNLDSKHIVLKFFIVCLAIYLPVTITRAIYLLEPNGLALDLIKYYLRIIYFFTIYIFFAFIWTIAEYYEKTMGIKKWFNETFGRNKGYD